MKPVSYACFQFPPAVIQHAVRLYLRLNLGLRGMEDSLMERGIDASYETIRRWIAR